MSISTNMQEGVLYFAVGRKCVQEAEVSATSLKAMMPQVPVAIFCNDEVSDSVFDYRFDVDVTGGFERLKPSGIQDLPRPRP